MNLAKSLHASRRHIALQNIFEKISKNALITLSEMDTVAPVGIIFKQEMRDEIIQYEKIMEEYEKNRILLEPSIVTYSSYDIKQIDLKTKPDTLQQSKFFKELFEMININIEEVLAAYQDYLNTGNKRILNKLETKINTSLQTASEQFNNIYQTKTERYLFKVDIESSNILFEISVNDGEDFLLLDYQSAGFKWFFNFYFSMSSKELLNPGTIILMDEPGTNIHSKGQTELSAFLRKFAYDNGLTFLVSTHSPFFTGMDHLEELKIVSKKDMAAIMDDVFTMVNPDDPDSLEPIREAFTIERRVILDEDNVVVFVEGITDYNYLTAFKKLLGREKITFIPIQGVGKSEEEMKSIIERLKEIRKAPMILVDSDKNGLEFGKLAEDSGIDVTYTKDIKPDFEDMESLFDMEDIGINVQIDRKAGRKVNGILNSCNFKREIEDLKLTDKTIKNFEITIDFLIDREKNYVIQKIFS